MEEERGGRALVGLAMLQEQVRGVQQARAWGVAVADRQGWVMQAALGVHVAGVAYSLVHQAFLNLNA